MDLNEAFKWYKEGVKDGIDDTVNFGKVLLREGIVEQTGYVGPGEEVAYRDGGEVYQGVVHKVDAGEFYYIDDGETITKIRTGQILGVIEE